MPATALNLKPITIERSTTMKTLFRCVLAVFFCVVMVNAAYADIYYEMESDMEINPKTRIRMLTKNYLADNYWRMDSVISGINNFIIIELESGVQWSCDVKSKTCTKQVDSGFGKSDQSTEGKDTTQYTPTNEIKTISGFDCKMYHSSSTVSNISNESDHCISKDVPGYREYKRIMMKWQKMMGKSSFFGKTFGGRAEVDGFPVQNLHKTKMPDGTTNVSKETVTLIEEKPLDRNLFKIPDGYKVVVVDQAKGPSLEQTMNKLATTPKATTQTLPRRTGPCFIGAVFSEEESD
jgi:hypothetical protein